MAYYGQPDYSPNHDEKKVWLQSVGWHSAKYGSELKVGDTLVYNFGSTGEIKSITPSKSGKTATIETLEKGKVYTSRIKMSALHAVKS